MRCYQVFRFVLLISEVATGKIKPVSTIEEGLLFVLASIPHNNQAILQNAIDMVSLGLVSTTILEIIDGIKNHEITSIANNNSKTPSPRIHPTRSLEDAPYDIPEDTLRSAIYIPAKFSYGKNDKIPVLLVPGTADPAGSTYYFNYAKLFAANPHTDPVWVFAGRHPKQRQGRRLRDKLHLGTLEASHRGAELVAR